MRPDLMYEKLDIFLGFVERIAVALEKIADEEPDENTKRQVRGFSPGGTD